MKLGIALPNTLAHATGRELMLSWARTADAAGFHGLSTIDKPNRRYYTRLWADPADLVHTGPTEAIAEAVPAYAEAGLDELHVIHEIPDVAQVDRLAGDILPAYR